MGAFTFRTLLLDVGGTLVFPSFQRIAAELAAEGIAVTAEALAAREPYGRFAIDRAELVARTRDDTRFADFLNAIARACQLDGVPAAALARLRAYHDVHNLWEHVPAEMPELLAALARRYRLAVVSNANGTVAKKLARLGLADHFELIVDSADEGIEKPDPALFRIALDRLGAAAAETAYVGDFFHIDVVGARAAGLTAILLDPCDLHGDKDCPRIRTLAELTAS